MSRDERDGRRHWDERARGQVARSRYSDVPPTAQPAPPRPQRWTTVFVILAIWSLVAWLGYISVDGVLGWVAINAGLLVESGKDFATASGAGKEVGSLVEGLNLNGLLGQIISLLQIVVKPVIVGIWAVGALVIIVAPAILAKVGRLLAARRS